MQQETRKQKSRILILAINLKFLPLGLAFFECSDTLWRESTVRAILIAPPISPTEQHHRKG